MLAAAASGELHTEQMDVETAFLYAEVEEEVFSGITEGMFRPEMPRKVLRLPQAIFPYLTYIAGFGTIDIVGSDLRGGSFGNIR